MNEIQVNAIEIEDVEIEESEVLTLEETVVQVIGMDTEVTAYKIATYINGVFKILEVEKEIPTQMMYNYTRNGMIAKGKKGKASEIRYTNEEAIQFVIKYTKKFTN